MVDVESLKAKKNAIQSHFDELEVQRQNIIEQMQQLRGEYRAIDQLITESESDTATKIEVKEAELVEQDES